MHVRMYVCMHACNCIQLYVTVHLSVRRMYSVYVYVYVLRIQVRANACRHVCLSVCVWTSVAKSESAEPSNQTT